MVVGEVLAGEVPHHRLGLPCALPHLEGQSRFGICHEDVEAATGLLGGQSLDVAGDFFYLPHVEYTLVGECVPCGSISEFSMVIHLV